MTILFSDGNELLTLRQVAVQLRLCLATTQRMCREGRLPAVKVGKAFRVRQSDLEAWYERQLPVTA